MNTRTLLAIQASMLVSIVSLPAGNAAPVVSAANQTTPAGLNLTAHFVSDKVMVGSAVMLQAIIKNTGTKPVLMHDLGSAILDFKICVTDYQGRDVPLTSWGKAQIPSKSAPGAVLMNLNRFILPGKDITFQVILNRQFDMSNSCMYHVVLTCPEILSDDGKNTMELISNPADVEVTEPTPEIDAPQNVLHF